ncbi:MAG: UDP-N-acetylglucosamine pyrophosphorylase [Nannocystaceae bacterium]
MALEALTTRRAAIEERLAALAERGVEIVDPRQTYVADDVALDRVHPGAVLHPGARLSGPRTFLGPGAEVGREGPATLVDAVLGPRARVDGGFARGAVLLEGASAGADAHLRDGTLLEEQASTAHCVGLKHTILLAFVTLGSLINFCDALMAGGSSREDHSEVGSGFIHFNFTPWGARGDKATPSLVGDVVDGVFLDNPRIFLGGSAGMVGPRRVGYGAITGAGQVLRRDVADGHLIVQSVRSLDRRREPGYLDPSHPRARVNLRYIAQLHALIAWYREVRLARLPAAQAVTRVVYEEALATLELCVAERAARLTAFLRERGHGPPGLAPSRPHPCPLAFTATGAHVPHLPWVRGLTRADRAALRAWLAAIVDDVCPPG